MKLRRTLALLLALMIALGSTVLASDTFTDVAEDAYYSVAVEWAAKHEITTGRGDGIFDPDATVTRAEAVTFLWRMAGQPEPAGTETFTDVESDPSNSWYVTAVQWAVENGITNGTGGGNFSPTLPCTRGMILTMIYRMEGSPYDEAMAAELPNGTAQWTDEEYEYSTIQYMVNLLRSSNGISDVKEGDYFELPIIWALSNEILIEELVDTGTNAAHPDRPCPRGEMVFFLYSVAQYELVNAIFFWLDPGPILGGSPWQTTVIAGNLPDERPELNDDLFTYFNYDYLMEHQDAPSSVSEDHQYDVRDAVVSIITDDSVSGNGLEQLRLFYDQAMDQEALKTQGITELQPYLDMIDSAGSLEEFNALLVSEQFPFSPFVTAVLDVTDTRGKTAVMVIPNFMLYDSLLYGGSFYHDLEDPMILVMLEILSQNEMLMLIPDFSLLGIGLEETLSAVGTLIGFEASYGQYFTTSSEYNYMEFGAFADDTRKNAPTFEDLPALCPNIPIQGILTKLGKDAAPKYRLSPAWLAALNDLWTEENLDTLKLVAKVKLLDETRPYRDQSVIYDYLTQQYGGLIDVPDAAALAYSACDSLDTFSQLLAQIYVENCLGERAVDRLTELALDFIDAYKELVSETAWLEDGTRERIFEKLDRMQLNILAPKEGYFDYSGLELTPSEEGGTLLGNYLKLKQYRYDRESELIGKSAIASSVWFEVQPTMQNAFYNESDNSINIYPGYITGANYSDDIDDCTLIAGLGFVIAHEISHGFDYQGGQFGAYGLGEPVYIEDDLDDFIAKSSKLASYYGSIDISDDLSVDGKKVIAEATADLCGLQAALYLAEKTDGFDYMDFFDSFACHWAFVFDPGMIVVYMIDSHPMHNQRINVSAQMLDRVYEAFGIAEGDGMYLAPEDRTLIWGENAA